jgi:uncharacterized protein YyaL (SSP411 family)
VLGEHPTAFAHLLGAYERLVTTPIEVAVVGARDDARTQRLLGEVRRRLLPASVSVAAPAAANGAHTPLLTDRPLVDGSPTAYVCERFACRRPTTDPDELREQLDTALTARR